MHNYRRTTSCYLISQALCFFLLLQGSGIAQALPLPPKKTFVTESELESARLEDSGPVPGPAEGFQRFVDDAWGSAAETGGALMRWLDGPWPETTVRVAQADGVLPLPPRLMSAFLASSSRGQAAPPRPPRPGSGRYTCPGSPSSNTLPGCPLRGGQSAPA